MTKLKKLEVGISLRLPIKVMLFLNMSFKISTFAKKKEIGTKLFFV